jgi:superfamily II DNA or RNA helicase
LRAGADLTVFAEVLMDRPTDGDGASDGASGDEDRSDALDEAAIPVGNPAFGVVAQPGGGADADSGGLVLAPLTTPLDATALDLVARPHGLTVPHDDEPRFLRQVLPLLAERFDVLEVDDSITLPEPPHPVLTLRVTRFVEHVAHLSWRWRYVSSTDGAVAEAEFPVAARRGADAGSRDRGRSVERTGHRDRALEAAVLERLGPRLGREVDDEELRGITTAEFFSNDLPGLLGLASRDADLDVELLVDADAPAGVDYRSGTEVDVSVDVAPSGGRDWFDLGILVHVDGRSIPFSTIFTALATGQNKVLMPDGLHFRLDDPRFERLREILDESGALQDSMGGKIRVGRYQAELFDELDRLGLIDAQAAEWRAALGALAGGAQPEHVDVPVGLAAELRGYQHEGFEWLVFLAEHGLGGVLADDMGLGKTVQTLAAVQRAHERAGFRAERDAVAGAGTRPAPVLVVAPTSVVDNWVAEAHRFTPGLKAVAVRATRAKRQAPLAETVGDADVVVTSYALFRLDAEEYQSVEWSGLVLDEAQFVKNRQSVAYRCARELAAPFKLALTGTPLENNLMELWSILSIVSPGLFPDPHRFADFYAGPIEREGHEARLELLRRKVTPFLLRRTKEDVAKDLPARQEQITEVTLQPRHRRVYDQYLQRERKNVLGLVDELDSNRFKVFRSLTVLRQASLDVSLVDESHAGVPSSKLDVLFEMLDDVLAEGHNVLVFSQFTQFLRRVRDRLDAAGTDYAYLDGRTRKRAAAIEKFTSGEAKLFLVSLKAGGFGLNLTAADYCILLDPWWNPAAEQQAVDRAHRIGQTRQVMVYRLVAADTIEDKVMTLKAAKSKLFASVLDGGTSASSGITADDVRALLG